MRTRTALSAALLVFSAVTVSCSSGDDGDSADKPQTTPTVVSTTTSSAYTEADCLGLLEENYTAGAPQDVSTEPECAALTGDQYADLVAQVITGHKDEILEDASNEVIWDTAWDELDADSQTSICALLLAEGPDVGEGITVEQAQYFLDNKC